MCKYTYGNFVTLYVRVWIETNDPNATYSEHMGKDIAALLDCDAAVFLDGWRDSKGCMLELFACRIYTCLLYTSDAADE